MTHKILLLGGDGIGPEVVKEAENVLNILVEIKGLEIELEHGVIGGAAIDKYGMPLPQETLDLAHQASSIILGAVGGEKWDSLERSRRPEIGLLKLRSELGFYANLRPALLYPELVHASTLKPQYVNDLDLLIVRELTGGIYFGEPRGIEQRNNQKVGFNTLVYSEHEIRRIADVAFKAAMKRNKRLCSVDKANVLEVSQLWRETVQQMSQNYPQVSLSHMYVDNAAMQLVREPKQFDVIVTSNMFGDILSDCAAMLTGSIGMLPSASLNETDVGLYEPVHGSAPDIANMNKANPLATILSVAMMLRYSLKQPQLAELVEQAVRSTLQSGLRTADISENNQTGCGTREMGQAVVNYLKNN